MQASKPPMQDVWPALASAQWAPLSQRVVEALSGKAQAQGLALLCRAYSTISAAQAAAYLGVPAAQLPECTAPKNPPPLILPGAILWDNPGVWKGVPSAVLSAASAVCRSCGLGDGL